MDPMVGERSRPIITHYQSSSGEFPRSITHTLPMSEVPDREAYGHKTDVDQLAEEEDARYSEMTPFITF